MVKLKFLLISSLCFFIIFENFAKRNETGLPLPRFVSLRSSGKEPKINLRQGPGKQYPTLWIYKRNQLPVKVISEFDVWRKIEDQQGTKGWVQQSMLSGKRTVLVMKDNTPLHSKPDSKSSTTALFKQDVILWLKKCQKEWCQVAYKRKYKGWILANTLYGTTQQDFKP
jgi:SH3-like domain-containing protein